MHTGRFWLVFACLATAGIWLCPRPTAAAVTNYVSSAHGDDANSGADWGNAWATLTNAVAQTAAGGTLVLSNGVHTLSAQLLIDKALIIVGFGESPAEVVIEPEGARINLLRLTDPNAVLENLTVRNGLNGIYLDGGGIVRRCIIEGNISGAQAIPQGGGVYLRNGGLVEFSIIRNNASNYSGGGAHLSGAGTRLRNCLVVDNQVPSGNGRGGGIFLEGSTDAWVENCTVIRNHAYLQAGGILSISSAGTVRNSIVMFNHSPNGMNLDGNPIVDNATILSPAHTRTGTTRAIDPQFMDFESGNYRLRPGSPAIDTGEAYVGDEWMADAADLDANPRLDGTVDVGAWEFAHGTLAAGLQPAVYSGFMGETGIEFRAGALGHNTNGLVYVWDFDNNGTADQVGADKAVVTNVYLTAGVRSVHLTITNELDQSAEYTFNTIKIGPRTTYVARALNADVFPYDSWSSASSNLQAAVDAVVAGSVVKVGAGIYALDATVSLREDIRVESAAGAEFTVIDGQGTVGCLSFDLPWFSLSNSLAAEVDGLTIRNGRASVAGVHMPLGGTVRNSIITNNFSTGNGVGGISAGSSAGLIEHCRIAGNRAANYGTGGAALTQGAVLRNSLIYGNWTTSGNGNGRGGVAFNRGGLLENCTLVGNHSPNSVGTGGISATVSGTVRNSIVYFNRGDGASGVDDIRTASFTSSSTHNLIGNLGGNVSGSTANPEFVQNGTGYGQALVPGNYRLKANSPAIDQGSFQASWMTAEAVDFDGNPRIYGVGVDIGAFEWQPPPGTLLILR